MDVISFSKAKKAQNKTDNVQEQLNQAVIEGDQLAETQQARVGVDGTPYGTLKDRLDIEKQDADQRLQSIENNLTETDIQVSKHGVLVTSFGSAGDWNEGSGTDNTDAFNDAAIYDRDNDKKLIIPEGKYLITGSVSLYSNVDCQGEIIIPNTLADSSIVFPSGEVLTFRGSEVLGSVSEGDNSLDVTSVPGVPRGRLSDYNYRIESDEKLITRLGSRYTEAHAYKKNESGQIKRVDHDHVYTKSRILYSYNDLENMTFMLSKKLPFLVVNNLRIRRVDGG